jgi:energy-converting hydrogenase Eha subunit E
VRTVVLAVLAAMLGFAAVLAIPTFLLLRAAPQQDRGGFTCSRSAWSQALHPDPDLPGTDGFDLPAACNRIARAHVRDVVVMAGTALLLIGAVGVVSTSLARQDRRRRIVVDHSMRRLPAHRA